MDDEKVISLIIPIYNRLEVTKQGLFYIFQSVMLYNSNVFRNYIVKIIVVDDGSTDGSYEWIAEFYPEIDLIKSKGDLWWTGAVNMGINHALDTFGNLEGVILQNDDIVVNIDWVDNLIAAITNNKKCLIGCATSTQKNKEILTYGGRKMNAWFATEKIINSGVNRNRFPAGHVVPSFDLYGRGLYIPVGVFSKVGLFNNKRFKHRGDMDLPLRAKKAGYNLLVCYDAVVYELPEFTYSLDIKQKISIKEAMYLLTDFRSSNNIKLIFYYSLVATNNPIQFVVFFSSNLFYNLRRVLWRVLTPFD